jgi:acyl carrier protein
MSETRIFEMIRDVLAKEFEISGDRVRRDAHMLDALDLDSLDVMVLAMALGDSFGIDLDEDDVQDCESVGDLAARVASRVASDS